LLAIGYGVKFVNYIVSVIICIICWGLWGFLPKLAEPYLDPASIFIYEFSAGVVIAIILFAAMRPKTGFFKIGAVFAILAGICGFGGVFFYLLALAGQEASIIAPFTGIYPVVTLLAGNIILKERYSGLNYVGAALAIAAIILLSV
jgi:transporter family protein